MGSLPTSHAPPVIRADFSDEGIWARLKDEITRPTPEGFEAWVVFLEDPTLEELDEQDISVRMPRSYPHGYQHPVVFVVDRLTIIAADHPVLVISTDEQPHHNFRCVPGTVQAIQNNLSLSNMDFVEFAGATDDDGVFRGF